MTLRIHRNKKWSDAEQRLIPYYVYFPDLRNTGEEDVLAALFVHAAGKGFCWPKVRTIARQVGLTDRQVRRVLDRLSNKEKAGGSELDRIPTTTSSGRLNGYLYILHTLLVEQGRYVKVNLKKAEKALKARGLFLCASAIRKGRYSVQRGSQITSPTPFPKMSSQAPGNVLTGFPKMSSH